MIRIIGIGSPFGDDAAGLVAAQQLAAAPPPSVEVIAADRPGAALIELLDGADAVILIDAAHSGAPPGTVHDLDLRQLPQGAIGLVSSHDLGVIAAVQLAITLGRCSLRGRVLAIETLPLQPSTIGVGPAVPAESTEPPPLQPEAAGTAGRTYFSMHPEEGQAEEVRALSATTRAAVEQAAERARQWANRFRQEATAGVSAAVPLP